MYEAVTAVATAPEVSVEELVADTISGVVMGLGVLHVGATLVVLAATKRMRPALRAGLVATSLLVPVLGPVAAVLASWLGRPSR